MPYAVPLTRREAIIRQLRDEIVTRVLPPGAVIKDAEVAARLGVSITPVREAIAQLAAEGLIDIAPNRIRRVTYVTQKNALELIDVMGVLACAGVEWGLDNLTETHLEQMRERLGEFVAGLQRGDVTAAAAAGADFSTIMIMASGNRELQTHVDLVVARTLRLLALNSDSDLWQIWVDGYREVLALLERGDRSAVVERYRAIYQEYRAHVQTLQFPY
ncbi:GntR family transcriptional regulator [Streptomyces brasiliensis]|uniref:GntR family transcriptional regulator n=1 Tax=Streptomyces brasiliensis TaxID=1954 RepID=A0A917PCG5_9ACTN|nr:GntR family transcriptional regulator [Streptomyces brasiliensis]GGJ70552.1 GntR family transcriptional regulator [Streptomyces brasiliensis]